ncbi:MAG: SDR family NAD(P)-dependent oxidoreductase [Sinimarinibacterium sp.]|jgi:NAD(P)-dependent dehydrogenase (short-subunit alcohol dehydrogenase family)
MSESPKACAVVVGAGARQGIGGALCARFAAEGLPVYAVGRSAGKQEPLIAEILAAGGKVTSVAADSSQPAEVKALFDRIAAAGHVPELVVFNASERNLPTGFEATTPEFVEKMWRTCCFGGFLVGHEAIARMRPEKRGTLIFTGATASLRGRPKFAAFAAAKAGLRIHAQAFAREFGPEGIHVAHVVIDGIVSGERATKFGYGVGKALLMTKGEDGALQPDAVAEAYWQLHLQHRSAWTHELDLRPFKESF